MNSIQVVEYYKKHKSALSNGEKCDVTSRYRGSKISRSQLPFLDRDGHLHCRTMEKTWATVLFLSEIMHRKVKQVNFFRFLISLFAGPRFFEV